MHAESSGQSAVTVTYCTNIHPARGLAAVKESLEDVSAPLKARLAPTTSFPLGLRLSNDESAELEAPGTLDAFRAWLDQRSLRVACINGFPFGAFHSGRVKDDVHRPDWSTEERVRYTLRLGRILTTLLPKGAHGGVSTSPLSYQWWNTTTSARGAMTTNIARIAIEYGRLARDHAVDLHLDIEPEPDGLLPTSAAYAEWFEHELAPQAEPQLAAALGLTAAEAAAELRRRIAVCLDTCHAAVEFESPESTLKNYVNVGMRIGRVQVSSALCCYMPTNSGERADVIAALRPFAESTYLHQTVERRGDGSFRRWCDLPEALGADAAAEDSEWRIHYHVPIFHSGSAPLLTTQTHTVKLAQLCLQRGVCDLFEAETYTWGVLPPELRLDLVDSIERELRWLTEIVSPR